MTKMKVFTSVAFVSALALASAPAFAQQHRGGRSEGRSYSGSGYRGGGERVAPRGYGARVYAPRGYYARPYYARPYYSFRPRVSIGLGLWLGYPVAYPYYYEQPYATYPYADPYAYDVAPGYAAPSYGSPAYGNPSYGSPSYGSPSYPSGSYQGNPPSNNAPSSVVPRGGQQNDRGGLSFSITPEEAEVFIDGQFAGNAADFGPESRPLDLSAGRHRVEVRAQGYRDMSFDADVRPGQVLPVQGTLPRN